MVRSCSSCSKKMLGPHDTYENFEYFQNNDNIKKLRRNRILFFSLLTFLSLFLIYIIMKEI
jgi:hypothetical protein